MPSTASLVSNNTNKRTTTNKSSSSNRFPSPHKSHPRIAPIEQSYGAPVHTYQQQSSNPNTFTSIPASQSFSRTKRDTSLKADGINYETPGIGYYDTNRTASTSVATFSKSRRDMKLRNGLNDETPAVTDYNPQYNKLAKQRNAAAFSFPSSQRETFGKGSGMAQDASIGPGSYETNSGASERMLKNGRLTSLSTVSGSFGRPKSLTLSQSQAVKSLKSKKATQRRLQGMRHRSPSPTRSVNSNRLASASLIRPRSATSSHAPSFGGTGTIPSYSQDSNARFKANPAYSFGRTKRESSLDVRNVTPGPHDYQTEKSYDVSAASKKISGPASFDRSKRKTMDFGQNMDTPGVAHYKTERALDRTKPQLPRNSGFGKSKRVIKLQDTEETPGVTDYTPNYHKRATSKNLGGYAPSRAERFKESRVKNSPDVHTYNGDSLKLKRNIPGATMHLYGR